MIKRWFAALSAALLCLGVSLCAGWLWQTLSNAQFEACARLLPGDQALPGGPADESSADEINAGETSSGEPSPADESHVLSPEVFSAAAAMLQERGVALPLPSPFDSVTDYLAEHTRVSRPEHAQPGEICIRCTAVESEEALQVLQAVVDAYLAIGSCEPADDLAAAADATPVDTTQVELLEEREQLTQAIERQKQSIAAMTRRLEAAAIDAGGQEADDPAPLETELGRVRQAHREAAARLAEARRDFDKKQSAEIVATRIADLPTRTRVLEQLNLTKVRDELQRQEALQEKWSAVYGRNHPRMVEIREKIETLEERLADFPVEEAGLAGRPAGSLPAAIVLAAFENESTSLEEAEQSLVKHLGDAQVRNQGQQELELQLGEARQELAFLHAEHDRAQKQMAAVRKELPQRQPEVLAPPALDRDPAGPHAGLPMAVSCVVGMALYLLLLSQIRAKWLAADQQVVPIRNRRPAPVRRERFRSQEEEQLMRLKLAARG